MVQREQIRPLHLAVPSQQNRFDDLGMLHLTRRLGESFIINDTNRRRRSIIITRVGDQCISVQAPRHYILRRKGSSLAANPGCIFVDRPPGTHILITDVEKGEASQMAIGSNGPRDFFFRATPNFLIMREEYLSLIAPPAMAVGREIIQEQA